MFEGLSVANLGATGLILVLVLMLFRGMLWTDKAYQQKVIECEKWEKAFKTSEEARLLSEAQNKEMLEIGRATYSILDAMFHTIEPPGKGGAHRVVQTSSK